MALLQDILHILVFLLLFQFPQQNKNYFANFNSMFVKLKITYICDNLIFYSKYSKCSENNCKSDTFERLRRVASFLHQPSFGSVQLFLMCNVDATLELLPGEL